MYNIYIYTYLILYTTTIVFSFIRICIYIYIHVFYNTSFSHFTLETHRLYISTISIVVSLFCLRDYHAPNIHPMNIFVTEDKSTLFICLTRVLLSRLYIHNYIRVYYIRKIFICIR